MMRPTDRPRLRLTRPTTDWTGPDELETESNRTKPDQVQIELVCLPAGEGEQGGKVEGRWRRGGGR